MLGVDPRWASYTFGCFLCIRCGGLHRRLGTHISRIKSITLDKWTDEQISIMQRMGNAKCNAIYCPRPDLFPPPVESDFKMEGYIKDKYEHKRFTAENVTSNLVSSNSTNRNSLQSSVTASSGTYTAFVNEAKVLKDMGFSDSAAVCEALNKFSGNIERAIDYLFSNRPAANSANTARPVQAANTGPAGPADPAMKDWEQLAIVNSLLDQLHQHGFVNDAQNKRALERASNNLEVAMQLLVQEVSQTAVSPTYQTQANLLAPSGRSALSGNPIAHSSLPAYSFQDSKSQVAQPGTFGTSQGAPALSTTQKTSSAMQDLLGLDLLGSGSIAVPPSSVSGASYRSVNATAQLPPVAVAQPIAYGVSGASLSGPSFEAAFGSLAQPLQISNNATEPFPTLTLPVGSQAFNKPTSVAPSFNFQEPMTAHKQSTGPKPNLQQQNPYADFQTANIFASGVGNSYAPAPAPADSTKVFGGSGIGSSAFTQQLGISPGITTAMGLADTQAATFNQREVNADNGLRHLQQRDMVNTGVPNNYGQSTAINWNSAQNPITRGESFFSNVLSYSTCTVLSRVHL